METIPDLLNSLLNHKIEITFRTSGEPEIRSTTGILKQITKDFIKLEIYSDFGEKATYYLSRHTTVLVSVVDFDSEELK